jgi:hypothetical protein
MEPSLSWETTNSSIRISQHFIKPEGLLLWSQERATYIYPQPDESSPYHTILAI